jgi:hypothetical protein
VESSASFIVFGHHCQMRSWQVANLVLSCKEIVRLGRLLGNDRLSFPGRWSGDDPLALVGERMRRCRTPALTMAALTTIVAYSPLVD